MAVRGVGSRVVPLSVKCASNLYWRVAVPLITYGLEITPLTPSIIGDLEHAHWKTAKQIQMLPAHTPNAAVLSHLGWICMESHIVILKLMFLIRILFLRNCVYKNIVLWRIFNNKYNESTSPVSDILAIANKYELLDDILNVAKNGTFCSVEMLKKKVKLKVCQSDWNKQRLTLTMYEHLELYKNSVLRCKLWPWWVHSSKYPQCKRKCILMARLVTGLHNLEDNINTATYCSTCDLPVISTVQHCLFECTGLRDIRLREWEIFLQRIPAPLAECISLLSSQEKNILFFRGISDIYINDFKEVYDAVLDYVVNVHTAKIDIREQYVCY